MKNTKAIGIILLILAVISVVIGFEKMLNYNEGGVLEPPHNAYVGGDAYNYIINASYATGYFVLGGAALISGIILILAGAFYKLLRESARE